jgi:hypothetical protein
MDTIAARLRIAIVAGTQPITATALQGAAVLYLRAPSMAFASDEKAAIVGFVRSGGSLLLVLDQESRQKLATTGVNDIIAPFGMQLTSDTRYLPNVGAIATAGEINRADREIPYDGGRAVEGGTPFAFQLDSAGSPGLPYAAWTKVDGGGRVVVMGEGMASLFLGTKGAARGRTTPAAAAQQPIWWGKDSAVFMEEVLAWLARR